MKRRFVSTGLLAIFALFLLIGQTAAGGARTDFTGTATTFELEWGEWVYTDKYIYVNNLTHSDDITADDPRLDGGVNYIVVYAQLDYEGNGRMWGTWEHVNGDGVYSGTYTGTVSNFWEDDFFARGTGVGSGAYAGQKIRMTNHFGSLSGTIQEAKMYPFDAHYTSGPVQVSFDRDECNAQGWMTSRYEIAGHAKYMGQMTGTLLHCFDPVTGTFNEGSFRIEDQHGNAISTAYAGQVIGDQLFIDYEVTGGEGCFVDVTGSGTGEGTFFTLDTYEFEAMLDGMISTPGCQH